MEPLSVRRRLELGPATGSAGETRLWLEVVSPFGRRLTSTSTSKLGPDLTLRFSPRAAFEVDAVGGTTAADLARFDLFLDDPAWEGGQQATSRRSGQDGPCEPVSVDEERAWDRPPRAGATTESSSSLPSMMIELEQAMSSVDFGGCCEGEGAARRSARRNN